MDNKQDIISAMKMGSMLTAPFACIAVQMALKAAIELNVFDILAQSGPPGTQLSASQIASKIPNPGSNQGVNVTALYRILQFLSSNSFLTTSLPIDSTLEQHNDRLFGLTALTAVTMARLNGDELPMAATFILYLSQKEIVESYNNLKCTVLNCKGNASTTPFEMVHGVGFYDYVAQRPDSTLAALFDKSMSSSNKFVFDNVIKVYGGFNEVVELMDVGGNHGSTLEYLISLYPNIQSGINFDLTHVTVRAPPLKGVKHVAGDMFQSLPEAKTIMLKWILHNWSDDDCVKLLKNCWRALPEGGKVIVVELVIPDDLEMKTEAIGATTMDICMLAICQGGRERRLSEFKYLATAAGFSDVNDVPADNGLYVLEFYKASTQNFT